MRVAENPDGTQSIRIEGFETRERRLGAPDLPTATYLVAIPAGSVPRLEARLGPETTRGRVTPRPVPRRVLAPPEDGLTPGDDPGRPNDFRAEIARRAVENRYEPDPRWYAADGGPFPERVAWLGEIGVLRNQRYVEVHVAPVRFDPALGGLRVVSSVELDVRFDGAPASARRRPHESEPAFEPVYRSTFANYEQGTLFRLDADGGTAAPSFAASTRDSSGPRRKIQVASDGLVRLDYARVSSTEFLALPLADWRVTSRGVAVPLEIQDDGDGILEPGEWVQFYGQALDDEPDAELSVDFAGSTPDLYEARDFTDTNVYFLTAEAGSNPTMEVVDAAPTMTRVPPSTFTETAHEEVDDFFKPLGGADPWYWAPTLVAGNATYDTRTIGVPLPGLAGGTSPLAARVHLLGRTEYVAVDPDHLAEITLRNASAQTLATGQVAWDNRTLTLYELDWNWPGSGPGASDPVEIGIEALVVSGVSNQFALDYVEVDYARTFQATADALEFSWPDGDAEFVVGGLTDPAPRVYEITRATPDAEAVTRRLTGGVVSGASPPYSIRFRVDEDPAIADGQPRRFLVAGSGAVSVPAGSSFSDAPYSDLRDTATDVDLVVIAHPDVLDTTPGQPLAQLLDYRATPQGGGLTSKVVSLHDIENDFNDGLPGATAIRAFLSWVLSPAGWAGKPSYVLLLGDGSYDYKGNVDPGNYVPTQIVFKDEPVLGYYASDSLLAAVIGDDSMPDLFLGRIPARSIAEAGIIVDKILANEISPPSGAWRQKALLISDRGKVGNNPTEAWEFEAVNEAAGTLMDVPPYAYEHLRYYTDYYDAGVPVNVMTNDILSAVNSGVALLQFIGHGNFTVWSDDAFFDERVAPRDTEFLNNGAEIPWLQAHNCLSGGFHAGEYTMGEDWLKRSGGGAVGVFSPTGLSYNFISERVIDEVWGGMFGPAKQRVVGSLTYAARARLCAEGSVEACQQYVVLGDPATRLALRSTEPATGVQAAAGNARVDLSWTASETAGCVYDIYRTSFLSSTPYYTKVNTSPVVTTSFTDSAVDNATTYYYYVVATDAEGFEGPWSNFNSDCGVDGPDCVRATPLNPDAPAAPTGLVLTDPGIGDQLRLDWAPNLETDLDHYTLHYGIAPGVYTQTKELGDAVSYVIRDLTLGERIYVALTASNTSGKTSGFSLEVSDFPVDGMGLRPPAYVDTLRVRPEGDDLVLEWAEVTTDPYGKPATPALYEIWRGSGEPLDHAGLALVHQCAAPCSSWTDPGAFAAPATYRYRVRAVDAAGNTGGMGSEPPEDAVLSVSRSLTPGAIVLSWTPVTSTVDGKPVSLSHYVVYASDAPFTRENVRDGLLPAPTIVESTQLEITPPAQNRYYSVLAVDTRGNLSLF